MSNTIKNSEVIKMAWSKRKYELYHETVSKFSELNPQINWFDIEKLCNTLHRYETSLHRINEIYCNDMVSEKELIRIQKRESNIEKNVRLIASILNFKVSFNGDPRGYAIRFELPDKSYNNFDGLTWCINW